MKMFQFYRMHTNCVYQITFWWYMILYRVLYFSFPQAWFFCRLERLYPPAHPVTGFVLKNTIKWPLYKENVGGNVYSVIQLAMYIASGNKLFFAAECKHKTQNYCLCQCQWQEPFGLQYEILNTASVATSHTEAITEDLLHNRR